MIKRQKTLDHPSGKTIWVMGYRPETGQVQLRRHGNGLKTLERHRWFSSKDKDRKVRTMNVSGLQVGYWEIFWVDLDTFLKLKRESYVSLGCYA